MQRLEIITHPHHADPQAEALLCRIIKEGGPPLTRLRTAAVYKIAAAALKDHPPEKLRQLGQELFADAVLSQCCLNGELLKALPFQWYVEVGFLHGVTDNVGRTAQESLSWLLNTHLPAEQQVFSTTAYFLSGRLSRKQAEQVAFGWLANPLVHQITLLSEEQLANIQPSSADEDAIIAALQEEKPTSPLFALPQVRLKNKPMVKRWRIKDAQTLLRLSKERLLALSKEEAEALAAHFSNQEVQQQRAMLGLDERMTDVELEVLAQTWSEHCKHKIFNARIHYREDDAAVVEIDSLFRTYIQAATVEVRKQLGAKDPCLSVFEDNAGVMRLDDNWSVALKVETHNSPSALDPYGGALTGIVGVNRDAFGTGRGGRLLFNTNVFCFAPPQDTAHRPQGLLHPQRIMEGVRRGVEHGGNKSGVPTVNGSLSFDERFLAKPLVFCGSGSLLPRKLGKRSGHTKWICAGDSIVMCGGRIGKDGIHGATFSSLALQQDMPLSVVQIGDPITQKKMFDFLLSARDKQLFHAITDNGAGGLSSSVGEMACMSGGATLHLERAPLKYAGLHPWEILLSEAQERMTLAVPPEHQQELLQLAKDMQVECTVLGEFTESGQLVLYWHDQVVGCLGIDFLHGGTPQMLLKAHWHTPKYQNPWQEHPLPQDDLTPWLLQILGRLNICSKEYVVRQYDHEVQGGSVIKPLCGPQQDGPSDAAVLRPRLDSDLGIAVSHGICPRYGDWDTYAMGACAMDEALRSLVAVGADPSQTTALDNFCWCDPLPAANNPHAEHRTAQLVRTARALYDTAIAYQIPFISGKDSMKNDFVQADLRLSIPPTVLITMAAVLPDVQKSLSMEVKQPDDLVYLIGHTRSELGGSEFLAEFFSKFPPTSPTESSATTHPLLYDTPPQLHPQEHLQSYQTLYQAIQKGWLHSAHDCSDGGLAVALAESAFAGSWGMELHLKTLANAEKLSPSQLLFAETPGRLVVTVAPQHKTSFEHHCQKIPFWLLGKVTKKQYFTIYGNNNTWVHAPLKTLKHAWQETLALQ